MRWILITVMSLSLSGCFWNTRDIEIDCKPQDRTALALQDPAPVEITAPKWTVITPANADQVWKKLENQNTDLVLFGLTDQGYEQLSIDLAELRNFISRQRQITQEYRNYYEPQKAPQPNK